MKSNVTFNPKRDLPYLAAIAQAVLYSWAGITLFGAWGVIPGAVTGALVSVTMAYASSQYTEVAKNRQGFALSGMVFLAVLSPIVVGTAFFLDLPADLPPLWRGVVGAALGIIPDVSVFLTGFTAGKGMVARDPQPAASAPAQPDRKVSATPKPKTKRFEKRAALPVTDAEVLRRMSERPGETYTELAQHFGVSRTAITRRVKRLLDVTEQIK